MRSNFTPLSLRAYFAKQSLLFNLQDAEERGTTLIRFFICVISVFPRPCFTWLRTDYG